MGLIVVPVAVAALQSTRSLPGLMRCQRSVALELGDLDPLSQERNTGVPAQLASDTNAQRLCSVGFAMINEHMARRLGGCFHPVDQLGGIGMRGHAGQRNNFCIDTHIITKDTH